jgi:polar amino acid transport system substrate-binding protein
MVTGIATRLEQVIINLLINASQALESPDDEITVTTEYDPAAHLVRVLVKDTGSGIPEPLRDNICEPFVTSKRQKGGAGLGLSVSTRIVNAHNGRLTFMPNQPKGTIFILELPVGEQYHATT